MTDSNQHSDHFAVIRAELIGLGREAYGSEIPETSGTAAALRRLVNLEEQLESERGATMSAVSPTGRDLAMALERLSDALARYAAERVSFALALERDRHDADIAELRAELHERPVFVTSTTTGDGLENIRAELAAMAERQTRLTQTVADLMLVVDPSGNYSIRAPEGS